MIPWIHPAQRRGARTRAGGRPPITQQVAMPQQIQRPQGGNRYMGGSTTTTGPAQMQQQQQSNPLGGLLAAKESYDQVNKAYEGGKNIRDTVNNFDPRSIGNFFTGGTIPTEIASSGKAAFGAVPGPKPLGAVNPSSYGAVPSGGAFSGSVGTTANGGREAVTGMTKGTSAGGVDALGAAGAGLGVGLNVHDMVSNGPNFANVTGALGSAALGYGLTSVAAANAWNPVGWTLLAASAADSIFDIF